MKSSSFWSPLVVVRVMVTNLPPGRRYLWLSLASHFLAAITNFAGFALLASFVAGSAAGNLRKRMALALTRGFVAASTWSRGGPTWKRTRSARWPRGGNC